MLTKYYITKFNELINTAIYYEKNEFCMGILYSINESHFTTHYTHGIVYRLIEKCQYHTSSKESSEIYQRLMNGIQIELLEGSKLN